MLPAPLSLPALSLPALSLSKGRRAGKSAVSESPTINSTEEGVLMSVALITGSAGLVGSEATAYFADLGFHVVGIDNDMRSQFFGAEATTRPSLERLKATVRSYDHYDVDIRDDAAVANIFKRY